MLPTLNPEAKKNILQHVTFAGRTTVVSPRAARNTSDPPREGFANSNQPDHPGEFTSWVLQRAGLMGACYRGRSLERRVSACLRALHAQSKTHARQKLEHQPELLPIAVSTLIIGVTEFFRDRSVFQSLRTDVIPRFVTLARPLRVWSAGCSNGAELYSTSILLAQAGLLEGSFLLGSDCRGDAVEHARAGLYHCGALRKLDPAVRRDYFEEAAGFWRPVEYLRKHIHWKTADIVRGIEEGPWDIILWRNMAIYLTVETTEALWRDLASALTPEGVLITGKAERPPADGSLIGIKRCTYRSRLPQKK